jgi:hypothetical protein
MRRLLETLDDRSVEGALCFRRTLAGAHPFTCELSVVNHEAEHLTPGADTKRNFGVSQEKAHDSIGVEAA